MPQLRWTMWIPFFSTLVSALPWFGPRETLVASATAEWSPAPTQELELHDLSKRLLYPVSFCGVQGPAYDNVYCSSDSSCAWFTDITVVGCCSIGGSCDAVYTSCLGGNYPAQTTSDSNVFTCTSNSVCYKNTYDEGYYQYGCAKSTQSGEAVLTSWPGINTQFSIVVIRTEYGAMQGPSTNDGRPSAATVSTSGEDTEVSTTNLPSPSSTSSRPNPPITQAVTSIRSTTSSDSTSTSISSFSSETSTLSTATSSQTTTADPPASPQSTHSSGLSTGATIAISVLAGVVALIALALCIFFFCIRRRRKSKNSTPAATSPSMSGHNRHTSFTASQLIPELEQPATKDAKNDPIELYDGVAEKQKSDEGRELLEGHREGEVDGRNGMPDVYEVAGDANWPTSAQELHGGEAEARHEETRISGPD